MPSLSPLQPTAPKVPTPPGPGDPKPKPAVAPAPDASSAIPADSLVLTAAGRARRAAMLQAAPDPTAPDATAFDAAAFEAAWREEIKPALGRWPGREASPVAIQQLRYADLVAGGRESEYVFERDPGQLMPATGLQFRPLPDPRTGENRLALREARVRVSAGRYDLILSVDGEGKLGFEKLFLDGKNVSRHAGDFVKGKIKEEPLVWGTLAVAGAAGVVALAHNQAAKTGKPVGFDAASVKLYRSEHLEVKAKLRGELTGTSSFVRAAGAEIGTTYRDGPLVAAAGVRYGVQTKAVEARANLGYQFDRQSALSAAASYDQRTKAYSVGVIYQATF